MPLRGNLKDRASLVVDETPYFSNLDTLDAWAANPPKKLTEPLKYYPSTRDTTSDARGKLLVCHDFQGGYTELQNPSTLWYTFNYLSYCDTFVYFSHQCVTVPPSGWITAAHRQGVKMLGTLIFERQVDPNVLRLITGPLPKSQTVSVQSPEPSGSIALSPHYARILADLAYQRGFDGYLLNFESSLQDRVEQARALASWVTILQSELQARIGSHAQTVWYDGVTYQGDVIYQQQVDSFDLPFFIPSTGFFSDYHWEVSNLSYNVTYQGQLDPKDFGYVQTYGNSKFKSLRDIFVGVDMYGRGTWYQEGFGCYKALAAINQANVDLSVAIFAPGWTWGNSGSTFNWNVWFDVDKKLWVGPNDSENVTRASHRPKTDAGTSGPICKSFTRTPPPNPAILAFHTSFCPGAGFNWYVNGAQVLQTTDGWTDLQKQTSLGDMLWPKPIVQWSDDKHPPDVVPTVSIADKSWNGGSCLALGFTVQTDNNRGRIPIQSLTLTPGQEYDMSLICNTEIADRIVKLDLNLSVDFLNTHTKKVVVATTKVKDLPFGWRKLHARFSVPAYKGVVREPVAQFPLSRTRTSSQQDDVLASVGLDLCYSNLDLKQNQGFSFVLGQMNVAPVLPPALDGSVVDSKVLWADFESIVPGSSSTLPSGVLTWDVTSYFIPSNVTPASDTKPPWTLQNPESWLPRFIYFNIYVQAFLTDGSIGGPEKAIFMGTTGLDGRANRFFVDTNIWPDGISGSSKARLYIQGVTDHGDVLAWDHCAFVDINLS